MSKLERLQELATSIRPLERDGQSLLYPDGDEACFCRYDLGAEDPCDLAEFIELMQKTLPGLLQVCDAYIEAEAELSFLKESGDWEWHRERAEGKLEEMLR